MMDHSERIVRIAKAWVGTPYRHQASKKQVGSDCLGLLRGVWREVIGDEPIKIPPYKANWRDRTNAGALENAANDYLISSSDKPMAGDVILFKMIRNMPAKHCAIMIDENHFIHAQEHIGVVEASLSKAWASHVFAVYKFPIK